MLSPTLQPRDPVIIRAGSTPYKKKNTHTLYSLQYRTSNISSIKYIFFINSVYILLTITYNSNSFSTSSSIFLLVSFIVSNTAGSNVIRIAYASSPSA